jgi:hypothetical protein
MANAFYQVASSASAHLLVSQKSSQMTYGGRMWVTRHMLAIIAIITIGLTRNSAHAQTAPCAVKWSYDDLVEVKRLDSIVMADQLEIHSIAVNKGNCPIATTTNGAVELSVNDAVEVLGKAITGQAVEPLEQSSNPTAGLPLVGVFGEDFSVYVLSFCNI